MHRTPATKLQRQVTGARAYVQSAAVAWLSGSGRRSTPASIHAQADQPVQEVVTRGDAAEHPPH